MRRSCFLALLSGVMLFSAGLLATASSLSQEQQRDMTLRRDSAQVAQAFGAYFERARSLDLLLAQSPAFRPPVGRQVDYDAANRALGYLEGLYPGTIGESCVIDERGHELARVTRGVIALPEDLSTEEAKNDFFTSTLAASPGQVHQGRPYVSPDTGEWVVSNSTWIRKADGGRLVVHFEVTLGTFASFLPNGADRYVAVVDRQTGQVILQDDLSLPAASPRGAFRRFPDVAALRRVGTDAETIDVGGRRLAVAAVDGSDGNANDWVVVEWARSGAAFLPLWVGVTGTGTGIVLLLLFVTGLRRQQSSLRMVARLDHLTGLANRRALEEALDAAVEAAARPGGERVALLMLDLDGFKQINDTLGHGTGDLVLQEIGRRLHANTFDHDVAARMGGDEFAVVLRQLREAEDVAAVAHRLRDALIRPVEVAGVPRFIGVSVGASVYADHGLSSAELLRAADAAMYQAKQNREGVRVYDSGTPEGAQASGYAAELLFAIENDQVTLAFQPEYCLETGRVVGVEALARWRRSGGDEVPPAQFIALAERAGLIRQLTHLTLCKALDEAVGWRRASLCVPVSVNLSAQLASDRSLPATVLALLAERGLAGECLVLEITETTVIRDLDVTIGVLQELRALGVRTELDDFGSGYASFKALHDLPLDGVKIDRDLVNDVSAGGQRLLAATIDIARSLGLTVTAEGIEDRPTLELVQRLGAQTAQGFHLAPPMDAGSMWTLLELTRAVDAVV